MDADVGAHFEAVVSLARSRLTGTRVIQNEVTANRAILEIHGKFGQLDVRIKEIRSASGNSYSYYLLYAGDVLVGFDNHPDVRVIKKKYGRRYKQFLGKSIPHRHGSRKQTFELTDEYTASRFLEQLEELASST
ncbi:MAG: hypothetical protein HY782_28620 [Chloroflexi bacterium]|nr:hypothetical protein [Chloroflexota bacterium]